MWNQAKVQHEANQANQTASVINAGVISIVVILVILIYSEIESALPSEISLSGLLVFRSHTHEKPTEKFPHVKTPALPVLQNASTNATAVFANAFEIAPLIALVISFFKSGIFVFIEKTLLGFSSLIYSGCDIAGYK